VAKWLRAGRRQVSAWLEAHTALRFLVAGALNTLFGFVMYAAALAAGLSVRAGLFVGLVAGSVFNFITTGGYAFRQLALSRYPLFVVCYLVVYVVNVWIVESLAPYTHGPLRAQAVALVPMALLSYWLLSRWVFAPGKR